jgi:shikimate dehydrogenase
MPSLQALQAIRRCVSNSIEDTVLGEKSLAGVIGDIPSHYSKSPSLWNAAFAQLQINASYFPFDVDAAKLQELLMALKDFGRFIGANVTVPYKTRVMDFLDEIDPGAARINAVNTIVRTSSGKLIGYNTDGAGFIGSLLQPQPDRGEPFMSSLKGTDVLLLGAGGAARAVAFHLADTLNGSRLLICNRTSEHATALAEEINTAGGNATAIVEEELKLWAPKTGFIVNCTTKGQGGIRRLAEGMATCLEPYSALAPAQPPSFRETDFGQADFEPKWSQAAQSSIEANHRASMQLAVSIPAQTCFYDLIYHPEETVFLRHGRMTAHSTMNGKAMIVNQAVIAFCERICRAELHERGIDTLPIMQEILEIMYRAW